MPACPCMWTYLLACLDIRKTCVLLMASATWSFLAASCSLMAFRGNTYIITHTYSIVTVSISILELKRRELPVEQQAKTLRWDPRSVPGGLWPSSEGLKPDPPWPASPPPPLSAKNEGWKKTALTLHTVIWQLIQQQTIIFHFKSNEESPLPLPVSSVRRWCTLHAALSRWPGLCSACVSP